MIATGCCVHHGGLGDAGKRRREIQGMVFRVDLILDFVPLFVIDMSRVKRVEYELNAKSLIAAI
jgi:hypothetical protein